MANQNRYWYQTIVILMNGLKGTRKADLTCPHVARQSWARYHDDGMKVQKAKFTDGCDGNGNGVLGAVEMSFWWCLCFVFIENRWKHVFSVGSLSFITWQAGEKFFRWLFTVHHDRGNHDTFWSTKTDTAAMQSEHWTMVWKTRNTELNCPLVAGQSWARSMMMGWWCRGPKSLMGVMEMEMEWWEKLKWQRGCFWSCIFDGACAFLWKEDGNMFFNSWQWERYWWDIIEVHVKFFSLRKDGGHLRWWAAEW